MNDLDSLLQELSTVPARENRPVSHAPRKSVLPTQNPNRQSRKPQLLKPTLQEKYRQSALPASSINASGDAAVYNSSNQQRPQEKPAREKEKGQFRNDSSIKQQQPQHSNINYQSQQRNRDQDYQSQSTGQDEQLHLYQQPSPPPYQPPKNGNQPNYNNYENSTPIYDRNQNRDDASAQYQRQEEENKPHRSRSKNKQPRIPIDDPLNESDMKPPPDFVMPDATCSYCGGIVVDHCINAVDETFHPEHFQCGLCGVLFPPGTGFLSHESMPYCERDYFNLFGIKCPCGRYIIGEYVSAVGKEWHKECFGCTKCGELFMEGTFFEYEGQAYCEADYHEARGSWCNVCRTPIVGNAVLATSADPAGSVGEELVYKYHPECFRCSFCTKPLATIQIPSNVGVGGDVVVADELDFREKDGRPFCVQCYGRSFRVV